MKISNGLEEHTIDPDLSLSTAPWPYTKSIKSNSAVRIQLRSFNEFLFSYCRQQEVLL